MTPETMATLEALAREHPRKEGEGILEHIQRLALLAGLVTPEDANLVKSERRAPPAEVPQEREVRLPYRENDDEWYARQRAEEESREQERVERAQEGSREPGADDAPVITEADITDDDVPF